MPGRTKTNEFTTIKEKANSESKRKINGTIKTLQYVMEIINECPNLIISKKKISTRKSRDIKFLFSERLCIMGKNKPSMMSTK